MKRMSTTNPELVVAIALRDAARSLRSMAASPDVAKLAIREEERYAAKVLALEKQAEASGSELELAHAI